MDKLYISIGGMEGGRDGWREGRREEGREEDHKTTCCSATSFIALGFHSMHIINDSPLLKVSLINGPEIISKYLGESEKNLRSHFKNAHKNWEEFGELSDLFVIIIDEIDAICKPRGKTDQSAAGVAYDALVNQLLTLMDGLNEVHNTLVVGLTNRRELLDPALLRPGRFEVQIEVTLPDEEGRREIFEIHTREMRRNGLLAADVSSWELAANSSQFSGAEIAGVVRAASSYALERQQLEMGEGDFGTS